VKTESHAALKAAKKARAEATTAAAEAAMKASADAADGLACQDQVSILEQRRASAIASAKPDDALAIGDELLRARVAVEIATSQAAASATKHAEAVEALREVEADVTQAARAQFDAELIALADTFTAALDAALEVGEQLQTLAAPDHLNRPLNAALPTIPATVQAALKRLPKPNPLDVPLNILRGGNGGYSDTGANRLAQLIA
jgi:hypothetical protein